MIISSKGKIGKTYLCIQLSLSVAFGREWLGCKCEEGRVLFINPEVDEKTFDNRVHDVCEAMGVNPREAEERIDVWNTRKTPVKISEIIEAVGRFAHGGLYSLIILDSVSCYLEGDENSSFEVREFTTKVNELAEKSGAAVLMVQHYGKGNQGEREAADRARGSSVFLDAPDTVLTITELFPASGEVADYLQEGESAYKIECAGMRTFGPFAPINVIRKHPIVVLDVDGITSGWTFSRSIGARQGGEANAKVKAAEEARDFAIYQNAIVAELMRREDGDSGITCKEAAELVGIASKKASQKLNSMFTKYGNPSDYTEGEFTTKAYSTDLLVLRKKPGKRACKAEQPKGSQDYYIFPRFRIGQYELEVDG